MSLEEKINEITIKIANVQEKVKTLKDKNTELQEKVDAVYDNDKIDENKVCREFIEQKKKANEDLTKLSKEVDDLLGLFS